MRTKLLILAAACSLAASAQQVEITSRQQLLKGTESGICNPVLSADGQKLLFTHADYKGLKLYDFSSDVTTTIATDDMAGFHPSFSRDGKSVYFLSQTREDMRVYREVKAYNLRPAHRLLSLKKPAECRLRWLSTAVLPLSATMDAN